MSTADRMARRLDQVDRKSLISVSRAMRARDVSRPIDDVHAALDAHESRHRGSSQSRQDQPVLGRESADGSSPDSS